MTPIYAFFVTVKGQPDWGQTINAATAGEAKSLYHRSVSESWPDIPFTAVRVSKLGSPYTSEGFLRNAQYRGKPFLKCGQRVLVGRATGAIVGHNSSANLDIRFDDDSPAYSGLTLNCHPDSVVLI
jgi:hypothetical protein